MANGSPGSILRMLTEGDYTERAGMPTSSLMSFPAPQGDGTVVLPRPSPFGARISLPRPRPLAMRPVYGSIALWILFLACVTVVVVASASQRTSCSRAGPSFRAGWPARSTACSPGRCTS